MSNQEYEYAVKNFNDHKPTELRDSLNKHAKKGWRLHQTIEDDESGTTYYIFERPVDE
jgi:hypothetical protein